MHCSLTSVSLRMQGPPLNVVNSLLIRAAAAQVPVMNPHELAMRGPVRSVPFWSAQAQRGLLRRDASALTTDDILMRIDMALAGVQAEELMMGKVRYNSSVSCL